MLRGRNEKPLSAGAGALPANAYPATEEPFATDERPPGIAFYKGKGSFFLPYALLESMRFQPEKITLFFPSAEVGIEGRGLHQLYTQLAAQKVSRIVEQGERYEQAAEAAVFIRRIDELPRSQKAKDARAE